MVVLLTLTGSAVAGDWLVVKLRGVALQQVEGAWVNLERGGVVSDDRTIRTLANARLELQREEETLELGPDTQINIVDRQGERFTTVKQSFGELIVDAKARDVAHFAVQTPYIAAVVVKGTRFTVTTDSTGVSVKVSRGEVAVEDLAAHVRAVVTSGQSAASGTGHPLVVLNANGEVVSGVLESTVGAATDIVEDVVGDGGVLGGVGDALEGSGKKDSKDADEQGSGGLGLDLNVLGLDMHL